MIITEKTNLIPLVSGLQYAGSNGIFLNDLINLNLESNNDLHLFHFIAVGLKKINDTIGSIGDNLLHFLIKKGCLDKVRYLIKELNWNPDDVNNSNKNAIMIVLDECRRSESTQYEEYLMILEDYVFRNGSLRDPEFDSKPIRVLDYAIGFKRFLPEIMDYNTNYNLYRLWKLGYRCEIPVTWFFLIKDACNINGAEINQIDDEIRKMVTHGVLQIDDIFKYCDIKQTMDLLQKLRKLGLADTLFIDNFIKEVISKKCKKDPKQINFKICSMILQMQQVSGARIKTEEEEELISYIEEELSCYASFISVFVDSFPESCIKYFLWICISNYDKFERFGLGNMLELVLDKYLNVSEKNALKLPLYIDEEKINIYTPDIFLCDYDELIKKYETETLSDPKFVEKLWNVLQVYKVLIEKHGKFQHILNIIKKNSLINQNSDSEKLSELQEHEPKGVSVSCSDIGENVGISDIGFTEDVNKCLFGRIECLRNETLNENKNWYENVETLVRKHNAKFEELAGVFSALGEGELQSLLWDFLQYVKIPLSLCFNVITSNPEIMNSYINGDLQVYTEIFLDYEESKISSMSVTDFKVLINSYGFTSLEKELWIKILCSEIIHLNDPKDSEYRKSMKYLNPKDEILKTLYYRIEAIKMCEKTNFSNWVDFLNFKVCLFAFDRFQLGKLFQELELNDFLLLLWDYFHNYEGKPSSLLEKIIPTLEDKAMWRDLFISYDEIDLFSFGYASFSSKIKDFDYFSDAKCIWNEILLNEIIDWKEFTEKNAPVGNKRKHHTDTTQKLSKKMKNSH